MYFDTTKTKKYKQAHAKLELLKQEMNKASELKDLNKVYSIEKEIGDYIDELKLLQLKIYKNHVFKIFKANYTYTVDLTSKSKTIQILEDFSKSKKDFMMFRNIFFMERHFKFCSLVVVEGCSEIRIADDTDIVMTDLKRVSGKALSRITDNQTNERVIPLINNLIKIDYDLKTLGTV